MSLVKEFMLGRYQWKGQFPGYCSRRQALKFLGFSTATAIATLGCQGTSTGIVAPTGRSLKTSKLKTVQTNARGEIDSEPSKTAAYFDEPYVQQRQLLPLRMVKIPAGEFRMGSPPTEAMRESQEGPQRSIQMPGFYIGAFAVTQGQYQAVVGNNPSYFTEDGANRPVEQVSWLDAEAFCQQLSELTGRVYRLPSEAEWEYACRAGTSTPFCFGDQVTTETVNFFADFTISDNPDENYRNTSVDADSFWPNAFGLYNMHGNIYEWCADDYHDSYSGAPIDASPWVSPDAAASKVMRGGSWFSDTQYCRSAARDRNTRTSRSNSFGFRVICVERA